MAAPMAKRMPYPTVLPGGERDPATVSMVLNNVVEGNLNVIGVVTLLTGTTETWVHDPRISPQSFFCWQLLDPIGVGGDPHLIASVYLKERGTRKALIGHQSPVADLTVEYAVFG